MIDTKKILSEWRFFLEKQIISEVKVSDFLTNEKVIDKIGQEVFEEKVFNKRRNKWLAPFNDNDYAQILYNSLLQEEEVDIQKVIDNYAIVKEKILKPFNVYGKSITANGGRKSATINSLQDLTFSKCNEYIEIKKIEALKTSAYVKCLAQSYNNKDFEFVGKTKDYLIFYPKTVRGSISLARSYYDLRSKKLVYDSTFDESEKYGEKIGRMDWCTSTSGSINYFNKYHVDHNIHMYYFIKIKFDIDDSERKLCVSLKKNNGIASLADSKQVFVDGDNKLIPKESIEDYTGKEGLRILFNDVESPERKELTREQRYRQTTLEDYINLRQQNTENIEDVLQDFISILTHSKERAKIANYIGEHDENPKLIRLAYESGLLDSKYHEKVLEKLSDNSFYLRKILTTTDNMNIISQIMSSGSGLEKNYIACNKNVPVDDLVELSKNPESFIYLSKNSSINKDIFEKIVNSSLINIGTSTKRNLFLNTAVPYEWKLNLVKSADEDIVFEILKTANDTDKEIEEELLLILIEKFKRNKDIFKFILMNKGLSADNFIKYGENILGASAIIYRKDIHGDLISDDMTRSLYILSNIAQYTNDPKVIDYILKSNRDVMVLLSILQNRICREIHYSKILELCIKRKSRYNVVKSSDHLELVRIIATVSRKSDTIGTISKLRGLTDLEYRTITYNRAASMDTLKHVLNACSKKLKRDVEIAISNYQNESLRIIIKSMINS